MHLTSQFPQCVPGLCSRSVLGRTALSSQRPRGRQEKLGYLMHPAMAQLSLPLGIGNNSRKATLYLSDPKLHIHRNFRPREGYHSQQAHSTHAVVPDSLLLAGAIASEQVMLRLCPLLHGPGHPFLSYKVSCFVCCYMS